MHLPHMPWRNRAGGQSLLSCFGDLGEVNFYFPAFSSCLPGLATFNSHIKSFLLILSDSSLHTGKYKLSIFPFVTSHRELFPLNSLQRLL